MMVAMVLQVLGLVAIVAGAALFSPVAGFIVGGLALALVGITLEKSNAA
jgi:uncharacterized membrane protein